MNAGKLFGSKGDIQKSASNVEQIDGPFEYSLFKSDTLEKKD